MSIANNGYVVSLQDKPPDLVLEIASRRTGHIAEERIRELEARLRAAGG